MSETPHSKSRHLYAVVRIDVPVNAENPENSIAVVKVFSSKIAAEREVSRLSELNAGKECRYVLNVTRLAPSAN